MKIFHIFVGSFYGIKKNHKAIKKTGITCIPV